ncbi:MAG TPA: peptide chain release factor N(5)-glutamine methyltransferase [Polyangia bacterium]
MATSSPPDAPAPAGAAPAATPAKAWTILEVIKWTTSRFAERGLPTPRLDAELLAAHAFGMARIGLYAHFDRPLQPPELAALRELVKRRQAGEPVAYLTGHKEFWSLDLLVDPRVLIPRPDTETAVQTALELVRAMPEASPPRVADIGTGSGAIALALKKELPNAAVFAVDVSADALTVARSNAEKHGLAVEFLEGRLAAPLAAHAPFDLVVANLPYVPAGDIAGLAPEVRREPKLALDGGPDGLDLVRTLVTQVPAVLRPGGAIVLEIGIGQAAATAALCRAAGFVDVTITRDLDGIERVVTGKTALV